MLILDRHISEAPQISHGAAVQLHNWVSLLVCYFELRHQFNRVGKFHEAPMPAPDLSGNLLSTCPGMRLVKKLRRKQMASYEAANQYLEQEYLPQHNQRFAQAAAEEEDYHGRRPSRSELQRIFRLETQRGIGNDWVVRHHGRFLQLQPKRGHYGPTQAKALVCEWEDGTMEVYYRGERLAFQELAEARKHKVEDSAKDTVAVPSFAKAHKPSQDHPWRRDYRTMKPNWRAKAEMPARAVARVGASL